MTDRRRPLQRSEMDFRQSQLSTLIRRTVIQTPPQPGFPTLDTGDKKFNSRLVAPTIFRNKPFGEDVEGLFHFRAESYAVQGAVQTDDFEDAAFRGVVGGKRLLFQGLREVKHCHRQFGCFIIPAVQNVPLR